MSCCMAIAARVAVSRVSVGRACHGSTAIVQGFRLEGRTKALYLSDSYDMIAAQMSTNQSFVSAYGWRGVKEKLIAMPITRLFRRDSFFWFCSSYGWLRVSTHRATRSRVFSFFFSLPRQHAISKFQIPSKLKKHKALDACT